MEITLITLLVRPVEREIDGDVVTVGNLERERTQEFDLLRLTQLVGKRNFMLTRDAGVLAFLSPLRGIPQDLAITRPLDIAFRRRGRQHDLGVFDSTAAG